jgi:hypothetical protein
MIELVPLPEPDYSRCRASVLTSDHPTRQCSRRPVELRQARDGQIYPVCRRHKTARFFEPWTHHTLITQLDASRAYNRLIEKLRGEVVDPVVNFLRRHDPP